MAGGGSDYNHNDETAFSQKNKGFDDTDNTAINQTHMMGKIQAAF